MWEFDSDEDSEYEFVSAGKVELYFGSIRHERRSTIVPLALRLGLISEFQSRITKHARNRVSRAQET